MPTAVQTVGRVGGSRIGTSESGTAPSNRSGKAAIRARVLARYQERYPDFGPTLAAEKLAADGLVVNHETLRRWLLQAGFWQARRKRAKHRSWRERPAHFGGLLQMDGSHHEWFEKRAHGRSCLMKLIDDATSQRMVRLSEQETIFLAGPLSHSFRDWGHQTTSTILELLAVWSAAFAAIIPISGLGIRAWFAAFQLPLSASVYEAKHHALLHASNGLDSVSTDFEATLYHIAHIEQFLRDEHREWLRLLLDTEWFV